MFLIHEPGGSVHEIGCSSAQMTLTTGKYLGDSVVERLAKCQNGWKKDRIRAFEKFLDITMTRLIPFHTINVATSR